MTDKYLEKAKELAKVYGIKTKDGLWSLADDIREVNNHFIRNALIYIDYCLANNLYDKDPFCEDRISLNELEI